MTFLLPRIPTLLVAMTSLLATAGCAASTGSDSDGDVDVNVITKTVKQKMVGGTISTQQQDATIMLSHGDESCSGSFIAPNLILTARHCVATPADSTTTDCVGYGPNVDASTISVKGGVNITFETGTVVAHGMKIYTSTTSNMCSFDVALVQIDQDLKDVLIAPLRFTDIAPNEPTIAVGYGVDGNNNELPNRMQRQTSVLGVGPKEIDYQTLQNTVLKYTLPVGDVATGESTCFGDSGGPLLDMKGNIVAITSRGINDGGEKGHGNTCIDEPSIYAGVKFNEALIRQAAQLAGHPLPAGPASTPSTGTKNGGTSNPNSDDGSDDDGSDDGSGDDGSVTGDPNNNNSKGTTSTKKSSSGGIPAQASGGCSAAPGHNNSTNGSSAMMLALVAAGMLITSRRRNKK